MKWITLAVFCVQMTPSLFLAWLDAYKLVNPPAFVIVTLENTILDSNNNLSTRQFWRWSFLFQRVGLCHGPGCRPLAVWPFQCHKIHVCPDDPRWSGSFCWGSHSCLLVWLTWCDSGSSVSPLRGNPSIKDAAPGPPTSDSSRRPIRKRRLKGLSAGQWA